MKIKNMIVLLVTNLLVISCTSKSKENKQEEISDTVVVNNDLPEIEEEVNNSEEISDTVVVSDDLPEIEEEVNNSTVIFSTEDLGNAKWDSPTEYPLKSINHEGTIHDNNAYVINLPNYKDYEVVIWSTPGGDDDPYLLCIVKSGIMLLSTSLGVSPRWSEPGNDKNKYCKKKVKIYEDYTIKINTEERNNGPVYKSVKYYRINDEGEFYEVKIENN